MNMEFSAFVILVAEMREAQKAYFRTRSKEYLNRSKNLERVVDENVRLLRMVKQMPTEQDLPFK